MVERKADDDLHQRLMVLGEGVQADFDKALAELADTPRRLEPRPDLDLSIDDAVRRTMREHSNVFAALAESERQDSEAGAGHANIRRGLAR